MTETAPDPGRWNSARVVENTIAAQLPEFAAGALHAVETRGHSMFMWS